MIDPMPRLPNAESGSIRFKWNGVTVTGRPGDSIAAALHAAGTRYLAPSRKFHEPRGLSGRFVAGHLACVDGVPHCRLDRVAVREGLDVRMQGVWPAASFDAFRLARLLPARCLRGGFEHPRFIPDRSWLWRPWERFLRFAAGVAPPPPRDARGEIAGRRLSTHTVIVGGGPTGIAAARKAGGTVVLITRGRQRETLPENVTALYGHEVFALYDGGRLVAAAPPDAARPAVLVDTRDVVLATGLRSTPPLVRGAALPGVMDATMALRLAREHGVPAGRRVVVVGTPAGQDVAGTLQALGVPVVEFVDVNTLIAVHGRSEVTGVEALGRRLDCDAVVHAGPWRPDPQLAFHASCGGELRLSGQGLPASVRVVGAAAEVPEPVHMPSDPPTDAYVCPCMDVTVGEVLAHVQAGVTHVEELKRLTGCGMGPCQGDPCWDLLGALIARATGGNPESVGHPSYRPPRAALTFGQAAGLADLTEVRR